MKIDFLRKNRFIADRLFRKKASTVSNDTMQYPDNLPAEMFDFDEGDSFVDCYNRTFFCGPEVEAKDYEQIAQRINSLMIQRLMKVYKMERWIISESGAMRQTVQMHKSESCVFYSDRHEHVRNLIVLIPQKGHEGAGLWSIDKVLSNESHLGTMETYLKYFLSAEDCAVLVLNPNDVFYYGSQGVKRPKVCPTREKHTLAAWKTLVIDRIIPFQNIAIVGHRDASKLVELLCITYKKRSPMRALVAICLIECEFEIGCMQKWPSHMPIIRVWNKSSMGLNERIRRDRFVEYLSSGSQLEIWSIYNTFEAIKDLIELMFTRLSRPITRSFKLSSNLITL